MQGSVVAAIFCLRLVVTSWFSGATKVKLSHGRYSALCFISWFQTLHDIYVPVLPWNHVRCSPKFFSNNWIGTSPIKISATVVCLFRLSPFLLKYRHSSLLSWLWHGRVPYMNRWLLDRHQCRHDQAVGQVHWHDPNLQRAWELCGLIVLAFRAFTSGFS